MQETLTPEPPITVMELIFSSGTFGAIVIFVSSLLVVYSTIGLITHRSKSSFYQWVLDVIVKFNLLTSVFIFAVGWLKFFVMMRSDAMCFLWQNYLEDLLRGIHAILFIALTAFGIKTLSLVKQKYNANNRIEPIVNTPDDDVEAEGTQAQP